MHFAKCSCIGWKESVSTYVEIFWQASMCWDMMNSTNRGPSKPLQEDGNLKDPEIHLISFDKRPGKMRGDAYSQLGETEKQNV